MTKLKADYNSVTVQPPWQKSRVGIDAVAKPVDLRYFRDLIASMRNGVIAITREGAIAAINAILGWIPMVVAAVMMVVIFFLNIDKDTNKMLEEKAAQA